MRENVRDYGLMLTQNFLLNIKFYHEWEKIKRAGGLYLIASFDHRTFNRWSQIVH